jgi:hypothetical protein
MTVSQLRQEAKELKDDADRVVLYREESSLDDAWHRLEELFMHVREVLGKRAGEFELKGVSREWAAVSERASHAILACDLVEPPPRGEIQGDYGT